MKLSVGFRVADSRDLPKVDYIMLMEFMHENDCYNIAEIRSAKALLASREAYVDTAVGYVEVKREGILCTVKCRVTPEHKLKAKLYVVTAVIDEQDEKIVSVECADCAASAGGCKHSICFAIWLIRRSDEPSVTSTTCYWSKPKLAGVMGDRKYILAKNIGKQKRHTTPVDMTVSLSMFAEECKRRKMTTGMILNYSGNRQASCNDFSLFNLMLEFVNTNPSDLTHDNFIVSCRGKLTADIIQAIASETIEQADSKLWHCMRQGRVTGSKIYESIHCKTQNGALVQTVLGGYKVPETKAMKRGKILESKVIEVLERDLKTNIIKSGFILISPVIGVSPEGVCDDFVIEIKCPLSSKTMKNYVVNGAIREKYKAQIMLEMHATKKNKGLFCVADPTFEKTKIIHKYWVNYDSIFAINLCNKGEEFWKYYIFDKIVESAK